MRTLLVLSKYQEIFDAFLASYNKYGKDDLPHNKLIVTETGVQAPSDWQQVIFNEPYSYSRIMNFAFKNTKGDVAFFSDDTQFTHTNTIQLLQMAAYSKPDIGAVSPLIDGAVYNGAQIGNQQSTGPVIATTALCYVAQFFREQALHESDPLDESLLGICWEDIDHSLSLGKAGWKCAVTPTAVVKHGFGEYTDGATWKRSEVMPNGMAYNQNIFGNKWRGKLDFLGPLVPDSPINAILKRLQEGK